MSRKKSQNPPADDLTPVPQWVPHNGRAGVDGDRLLRGSTLDFQPGKGVGSAALITNVSTFRGGSTGADGPRRTGARVSRWQRADVCAGRFDRSAPVGLGREFLDVPAARGCLTGREGSRPSGGVWLGVGLVARSGRSLTKAWGGGTLRARGGGAWCGGGMSQAWGGGTLRARGGGASCGGRMSQAGGGGGMSRVPGGETLRASGTSRARAGWGTSRARGTLRAGGMTQGGAGWGASRVRGTSRIRDGVTPCVRGASSAQGTSGLSGCRQVPFAGRDSCR